MPHTQLEKILNRTSFALLVLFLFLFFFRPIETDDVWWHLGVGRWIAEHGQVPLDDVFSCRAQHLPWFHTQWLGSWILYTVYSSGGFLGLKIFRALYFIAFLAFFFVKAKRHIPPAILFPLLLILAFGIDTRVLLRPLIANFFFLLIYLEMLFNYQRQESDRRIYALPLLSILWFNLHAGALYYGTILIGVFLFVNLLQCFEARGRKELSPDFERLKRKTVGLLMIFVFHFLAMTVNPYGPKGVWQLLRAALDPAGVNRQFFFQNIQEMKPPAYILLTSEGIWFFLLVAAVLACLIGTRRKNYIEWLLFIIGFFWFLASNRVLEFFLCVSMQIILNAVRNQDFKFHNSFRLTPNVSILFQSLIIIFLIFNLLHFTNQKAVRNETLVRRISLPVEVYDPQAAVDFLKKYQLTGNVFNWEGYGGSLIWTSYPELKPLADGRQVDKEAFFDYYKALSNPRRYWPEVEAKYNLTIALLDVNTGTMHKIFDYLINNPDWQFVFLRGSTVVLVKRGVFSLPDELTVWEEKLRTTAVPKLKALQILEWEDEKSTNGFFSALKVFLYPAPYYIDSLEEGSVLFTSGYSGAGLERMIRAYELTKSPHARYILRLAVDSLVEKNQ